MEGNRRLGMSAATAEILGPGITGVLVAAITAPIAILFDALSFVVSGVAVWAIRTPEPAPAPALPVSIRDEALAGARVIWRNPVLRALALRAVVAFLSAGTLFSLYVIYSIRTLHMSTPVFGFTIALGGVGSLIGAFYFIPSA